MKTFRPTSYYINLQERLSHELNVDVSVKKVYLGLMFSVGNMSTIEVEDIADDYKEMKRTIRRLLFQQRTADQDKNHQWSLEIAGNGTRDKDVPIYRKSKKVKSHAEITHRAKNTIRRQRVEKRASIYGQDQVETIHKLAREQHMSVDHIIPLHAVNEDGEWIACGLNVPSNLQLMTYEENNRKGNLWNR